jgi:hypothetical protein
MHAVACCPMSSKEYQKERICVLWIPAYNYISHISNVLSKFDWFLALREKSVRRKLFEKITISNVIYRHYYFGSRAKYIGIAMQRKHREYHL